MITVYPLEKSAQNWGAEKQNRKNAEERNKIRERRKIIYIEEKKEEKKK